MIGFSTGEAMKTFLLLALCVFSITAKATPGGVDKNGCHDSVKIGWHCHAKRSTAGSLPGDGSQKKRDERLKRECKGRPNAGACLGYTN
jgi:hypothetical protein